MVERRTMHAALDLTPGERAFIQGDIRQIDTDHYRDVPMATTDERLTTRVAIGGEVHGENRNKPQLLPQYATRIAEHNEAPPVLVPLTTRLMPATAEALRRAHLEQKLRRATPSTQQEIVEAAVTEWLRAHDFLPV